MFDVRCHGTLPTHVSILSLISFIKHYVTLFNRKPFLSNVFIVYPFKSSMERSISNPKACVHWRHGMLLADHWRKLARANKYGFFLNLRYTTTIELTHDDRVRLCSPTISTRKLNGGIVEHHHLWRHAPEHLIRMILDKESSNLLVSTKFSQVHLVWSNSSI